MRAYLLFFLYSSASVAAFACYWFDKNAARNRRWRTPENTLHLLGLFGGWPGALLAQKLLRHKTRKLSFQIVFWASVLINCGTVIWLCSPFAPRALQLLFF